MSATPTSSAPYESSITNLPLLGCGKVRENYAVGDDELLMITTDRLSAFDTILGQPVPGKGRVLAQTSDFWLNELCHIVPTHETGIAPETVAAPDEIDQVCGRVIVVKRLKPIPAEAVMRGCLAGSGWEDYQAISVVCGVHLASGLQSAQELPEPVFTPAARAEMDEHDESISFDEVERCIDPDLATQIHDVSICLYEKASDFAAARGIIITDTKFGLGLDGDDTLTLTDEALTADSSHFWPAGSCRAGTNPPSFDKQFVCDQFEAVRIDGKPQLKTAPASQLPADIIEKTADKYHRALARLTGEPLR